jgi:hypothetical protein
MTSLKQDLENLRLAHVVMSTKRERLFDAGKDTSDIDDELIGLEEEMEQIKISIHEAENP